MVSSTETGIHTLKNFGSRRNCSVSIIYPETVKLDSVDVGVTPKGALMEADFGITNKVIKYEIRCCCTVTLTIPNHFLNNLKLLYV